MTEEQLQEFLKILEKERPYLLDIDKTILAMDNGIITVQIRIYKSKVTDIVISDSKRIVYKDK